MASNLNKAFMRAYAKDRQATNDSAPPASTNAPPAAPANYVASSPTASIQPAPIPAARPMQADVLPAAAPVVAPPHTVFAGRYVDPKATTPAAAPVQPQFQPQLASPAAAMRGPAPISAASQHKSAVPPPSARPTMAPVNTPAPATAPMPNRSQIVTSSVPLTRFQGVSPNPQSHATNAPIANQPTAPQPVPPRAPAAVTRTAPAPVPTVINPTPVQPAMTQPATAQTARPVQQRSASAKVPTAHVASTIAAPSNVASTNVVPAKPAAAMNRATPVEPARPVEPAQAAQQIHAQASGVWQRIDQAQNEVAPHRSTSQARPTATVGAAATIPPRRLQAAATVSPSKPNVAPPAPVAPIDHMHDDPAEELPLISDQELALVDSHSLQAKRRTVADFLYAAGQYTPGRILTGHAPQSVPAPSSTPAAVREPQRVMVSETMKSSVAGPTATVGMQTAAGGMSSQTVHPIADQSYEQPMMARPAMNAHSGAQRPSSTSSAAVASANKSAAAPMAPMPVMPTQSPRVETASPITMPGMSEAEGPMPRRMGQILRVDVPRAAGAAAMPVQEPPMRESQGETETLETEAFETETFEAEAFETETPKEYVAKSAVDRVNERPTGRITERLNERATEVDAAARYILEQRRLDRAHQISEMEEKLRDQTHKVFNPVWEVDRLQWPPVVDKLMQHRAESMAQVAAHMKAACQDGLSVLGVSSAGSGEGRTTVACCLARLAAAHGLNVCLIDLDLDHPTLCIQTNMEVEHDWRDCLSSELTLEEVAVHSIEDQLTILPLKPRGGRPGLLASDSRLSEMLGELAESFELIVVDCARMNSAGNVISGLAHTNIFNAAILVVDRRDSEQRRIEDAVVSIQKSGIESIGIVDNFSM